MFGFDCFASDIQFTKHVAFMWRALLFYVLSIKQDYYHENL